MPTIELPHGSVSYRVAGPEDAQSPPVVFVHGFLVDGTLWTEVADRLAGEGIRSYAPDLPLGSHRIPIKPDADQSPRGVAKQVLSFLEALDLTDVTLVGNDTGGAICQFLLDTDASRIGRVVLTNCDAFDTFPPFPFSVLFRLLRGEARMAAALRPMRSKALRHSPMGFGLLANDLDAVQTGRWVGPAIENADIRRDAARFLRNVSPDELLEVSNRLRAFDGPVKLVWGAEDRCFTPELGERLAAAFRDGDFVKVPGARTFVSLDAPERVAAEIAKASARAR